MAYRGEEAIAISAKWQRVPGTWDEKVPTEVNSLTVNVKMSEATTRGYVVLGGPGWDRAKRAGWFGKGERRGILDTKEVKCITFDDFIARAWQGKL